MDKLLAKSGEDGATLLEHTQDVADAGNAIWQSVASDLRELIPSLPEQLEVWRAAAERLHDLMKANSAYQKMVSTAGKTEDRQPVRHELLAAAFLSGDGPLAAWFAKLMPDESERWAMVWAIAAHHFKMIDPVRNAKSPAYRDAKVAPNVTLFFGHPDVRQILTDAASLFKTKDIPTLVDLTYQTIDDDEESLRERITDYLDLASAAWEKVGRKTQNKALIAVLKALLSAADAAGSATAEKNLLTMEWVAESLNRRLSLADLQPVLTKDLGANREHAKPFQTAVGNSQNLVTVVTAGCGNGKTTAAYLWAAKWAIGKKLYFLYPTTGTATAGYEDYLAPHGDLDKALLHGRSQVDLAAIHGTNEESADEAAKKIESLRAWNPKVASCTVDTVLGLMQTQRRGVYSFPAFAAGAFVFDEIHAYDAKLWGGMLRFLKEFPGVRALLMSASIPPHRQKQLREIVGDRMGDIIKGDEKLEGHKRYRLQKRESAAACVEEVKAALAKKQKVLWVCNTVKDAIETAKLFRESSSAEPIIYHSRFRYCDRVKRQKRVIEEFAYHKNGPTKGQRVKSEASLVIATQVCEMSLDISADLLVTAECPLPSLVQRLGRLNRYASGDDAWPCLVYPFEGLPYNENPEWVELHGDCIASMKAAREAVRELDNEPCSQRDLAERLDCMIDSEVPEMYSALFDDGWVTEPMPVRDSDQSVTVILETDIEEIQSVLGKNRKFWSAGKLAPWTIPMNYPKWLKPFDWPTVGPYPRAFDEFLSYTVEEGAQWVRKTGE
jgi:CRISPR-associated endonuclease/helicase Cas3